MENVTAGQGRTGWLARVGAGVAAVALPIAWFASLTGQPDLVTANVARVVGALLGAGILARVRLGDRASVWGGALTGGVVGSLVVTGISLLVPAIGPYTASGWIVSGVVGGAIVALALFAVRGSMELESGG